MVDTDERQIFVETIIRSKKIQTFEQILKQVNCSEATLRRDIRWIKGITSFTHQGRFVTLKDIPKFDKNGIWFYRKVGFTKYKNSLELIVHLINNSKEGLNREQIQEILKIQIFQQIQTLLKRNELYRCKIGNKYIYLPEQLARNQKKRLRLLSANNVEEYYDAMVSSSDLVALLKAVLIEKKIKIDVKNLKRFAQKYSLKIPLKKVEQLLLKYNLTEKKSHRISQ
jgi:DeoR/GlpR family transcriptional regulator of sugar metabolism